MKTEIWSGYNIRFVEYNGEWWAVLKDIALALGLAPKHIRNRLSDEVVSNYPIKDRLGRLQEMLIVNEFGIYETVFESRKKEAKEFKRWVFNVIKNLRQSTGLEGFQIFRMLDKDHQKEAMARLKSGLSKPVRINFIKANTIANKAISNIYGYPKMLKKDEMRPEMLARRQNILDDTVNLMSVDDSFNLGISVSKKIYEKYN